jgi:hypothetical protein
VHRVVVGSISRIPASRRHIDRGNRGHEVWHRDDFIARTHPRHNSATIALVGIHRDGFGTPRSDESRSEGFNGGSSAVHLEHVDAHRSRLPAVLRLQVNE